MACGFGPKVRGIGRLIFVWVAVLLVSVASSQSTELVSRNPDGGSGNNSSGFYGMSASADGRYVAFESHSSNLVPRDTNDAADIFVRDRQTGKTERVSVNTAGQEGNDASYLPTISADGRYVAFQSFSSNLVAGDTNASWDVFVRDRQTGKTQRVSLNTAGQEGNGGSVGPAISADGRYVAFESASWNLVAGDTIGLYDVFVRDRRTGKTERVSLNTAGQKGNGVSDIPSISADGRYVAFESDSSNLVAGDTNGVYDVFVRDRQTGKTERVSLNTAGQEGNSVSRSPSISADGRYVAFWSDATNLVEGDTNGTYDVFVRDRQTGKTERVSLNTAGQEGNGVSVGHSISADGRYVAFDSSATNLVAGDTNGLFDVFIRDRQAGKTERFSLNTAGQEGNGDSVAPSISADGRYVAFNSGAINLVEGDINGCSDVFVRDRGPQGPPPVDRPFSELFFAALGADGNPASGVLCDNLSWTQAKDLDQIRLQLTTAYKGAKVWGTVLGADGLTVLTDSTGGHIDQGAGDNSDSALWVPPTEFVSQPGDLTPNLRTVRLELHVLTRNGKHFRTTKTMFLGRSVTILVHGINSSPDNYKDLIDAQPTLPWVAVDHSGVTKGNGPVELGASLLQGTIADTLGKIRAGTFNERRTYSARVLGVLNRTPYKFSDYANIRLSAKRLNLVGWSYGGLVCRWYLAASGDGPTGTGTANNSVDWYKRKGGLWWNDEDKELPALKDNLVRNPIKYANDVRKFITLGSMWRGVPACNWSNEILGINGTAQPNLGEAATRVPPIESLYWLLLSTPITVSIGPFSVTIPAVNVASQEVMAIQSPWLGWMINRTTGIGPYRPKPFQQDVAYFAICGDDNNYLGSVVDTYKAYDFLDPQDWFNYFGLEVRDGDPHAFSDGVVPLWSQQIPGAASRIFPVTHDYYPSSKDVRDSLVGLLNGEGTKRGSDLNAAWADPNATVQSEPRNDNGARFTWTFNTQSMAPWPQSLIYTTADSGGGKVGRLTTASVQDGFTISATGQKGKIAVKWNTLIPMTRAILHVAPYLNPPELNPQERTFKVGETRHSEVFDKLQSGMYEVWVESFYETFSNGKLEQRVRHVSNHLSPIVVR